MAFTIEDQRQDVVVARRRLWLNAGKDKLLPDGDPEAAFLFCSAGQEILRADAERYGLKLDPPAESVDDAGGGDQSGDSAADTVAPAATPEKSAAKKQTKSAAKKGAAS